MKKTVTIGIPAYHSEGNIGILLSSLCEQNQNNIKIERIIVYVDGSRDSTFEIAKNVVDKRIQIVNSKINRGFAHALHNLISRNKSDIFVGLNDDIRIDSKDVIDELVKPFTKLNNLGLVGGNIIALQPKSFIGRCVYASYLVYEYLRYKVKKGNSDLTCDGKIFAISKEFGETINLKSSGASVGNVDIYLYYENLKQKRLYRFAKSAKIRYRLPETVEDFVNQESRALISRELMKNRYGSLFIDNHSFPWSTYLISSLLVFIKYPFETLFYKIYLKNSKLSKGKSFLKWKLAISTKKLSLIILDLGSSNLML